MKIRLTEDVEGVGRQGEVRSLSADDAVALLKDGKAVPVRRDQDEAEKRHAGIERRA